MNSSLAPILQYFFTEHLSSHKQVSPRTIIAYRDSFRLLLQFLKKSTGKQPSQLCVQDLDAPAILDFLESLETERDNQVCSRNARLTAIRSFFHVVALRDPACVGIVTRVLAIPRKRTDKRLVGYLTREEIDAVLAAPDQATWIGRRDHALLLTMYSSGARLSEMTCMKRAQIRFDSTTYLQLHGKECHSYCISLRPRHETTGTHACRPACNLAFSLAHVLLAVRKGIGLGPCTDAHGAGRVEPMSEPCPA